MKNIFQFTLITFLAFFSNSIKAQNYFTLTSNGLPTTMTGMDVKDLDNDNDLDVLATVSSGGAQYVYIYTNNGSGTFSLLNGTSFSSNFYVVPDAKFIDIDGDNDQDVVIGGSFFSGAPGIKIYRNDGGSTFTLVTTITDISFGEISIAVDDLDNDNDEDFIAIGQNVSTFNSYSPFVNDGSGNFSYSLTSNNNPFNHQNSGQVPIIAKLDTDNVSDFVVANNNSYLAVTTHNGVGYVINSINVSNNNNAVVADVDGDGDNDIITDNLTLTEIWLNDGSANFTVSSETLGGAQKGVIAAGDIDNDGDIDIYRKAQNSALSAYEGGLYINDGSGKFYLNNSITTADVSSGEGKFVDLNGDGYLDLLIADNSGVTHYYENTFATNHPDAALGSDGSNHYIANHDVALNTLPITIEFWMQGGNTSEGILGKGTSLNGFHIGKVGQSLRVYYEVDATNYAFINFGFFVNDANWHHVAVVVDNSGMKLYGDGVLDQTVAWTGTSSAVSNTEDLKIGRNSKVAGFFSGNLDEVRIWSAARTNAEIIDNMCNTISNASANPNLVAYYTMNDYLENTATIFDGSNNHNNLSISSGTPTFIAEQVGCSAPALPVELVDFTGKMVNNDVVLNWQTASEKNNLWF